MKLKGAADTTREREVIERQIRHMARLVDDLLDISRLRRGAIELRRERFDLADAIERAREMTAPLFAEKRHHLVINVRPGLPLDADRIRIAQVFANLLANAAKYTEPGGRIMLAARADDGHVVVECQDNGIGISADLVPRIFDLFVQGQRGLDRRQGGLGLGLAVARTLVELHGGTITAHSDGTDRGSTFTVRLPLTSAEALQPRADDRPAVPTALPRIGRVMLVDDNRDALEMLLTALKDAGVDAFGVPTPNEALTLAARQPPALAVLDIGLPEMDGFALGRALRALANGKAIRLIALTGYGREQDVAAATAAGFDAFLVKPIDVATLLETLAHLSNEGQEQP
jgi:CheY-like chemotaxis protein